MEEKALGRPKIMGELEDLQKVSDGILEGSNASLDTFKEVGIALGNDPNFSTTITKQITGLSDDRGYLNSPEVTNLDNVELNGKYRFRSDKVVGAPRADNGVLDVTTWDTNLGTQEITYSGGDKWQRVWTQRNPLTITPWKQIATTDRIDILEKEELIPITYLNKFKQIWGGTTCIRKGNQVSLYLEISTADVTDKSLPITTLKYKPITPINVIAITDTNIELASVSIVLDNSNGNVSIHPWQQSMVGTNIIVTINYTTREVFR